MPILSIIIPIYNVEKYIDKCFESIYNQGVDETIFEVIAVNDGTPDNSMRIVANYSLEHKNLHVINKVNGGVSSARNAGIEKAKGKYIMFIDPDDYLLNRSMYPLLNIIQHVDIDILIFRSIANGKDYDLWFTYVKESEVLSGVELFNRGYKRGIIWGCLYKTDFIFDNEIKFPLAVKNCEDSVFFANCMVFAEKISFSNIKLYNHVIREGSATTKITIDNIKTYPLAVEYISNIILRCERRFTKEQINIINSYQYGIISQWVNSALKVQGVNMKYLIDNQQLCNYLPINKYKPMDIITYLKINLLNNCFPLYFYLCKIKMFKKK